MAVELICLSVLGHGVALPSWAGCEKTTEAFTFHHRHGWDVPSFPSMSLDPYPPTVFYLTMYIKGREKMAIDRLCLLGAQYFQYNPET